MKSRRGQHGNEAHVPTAHHPEEAGPRVLEPDELSGRTSRLEVPPQQGPQAADRRLGREVAALGRLSKGRAFDSVYSEGTVIHGPLFVLRFRPNDGGQPRWGFAIGKKLAPSAVVRNRVRRRLREAVRPAVAQTTGLDLIVTAKRPLLDAPYGDIVSEIQRTTAIAAERAR